MFIHNQAMNQRDIKAIFGQRVRELRKSQGYTQESFALHCNIDRSYMGNIERGECSITLVSIAKVAKGLKMPMSELLEGVGI